MSPSIFPAIYVLVFFFHIAVCVIADNTFEALSHKQTWGRIFLWPLCFILFLWDSFWDIVKRK